jgi:endonuclease/exonuclease/phosphatase family metal-dependent hydrolase
MRGGKAMILAIFNVENLFERPAAMNLPKWSDGRKILQDFQELNDLISRATYTTATKKKLLTIMDRNKGLLTQGKSKFIRMREVRGKLVYKPADKPREIRYNGRAEWIGWFELIEDQVNEIAIDNTARIVKEIDADILCVVEADNRIALTRFNKTVLKGVGGTPYEHVMLIDGNDERGIDVGILTRGQFLIESMVSHVDDQDSKGKIFSRDCAEYRMKLPSGDKLLVMINHFKSKGYGSQSTSNAKRKRQAMRVRSIYEDRRSEGWDLIAVVGDFNDTPESDPLKPLLKSGSDLIDVMAHPKFVSDGRPGTYANGTKSGKIDYILLSPALSNRVITGGIERRGVWGGKHGTLFPHLPEINEPVDAASDHAAVWVDFQ